MLEKCWLRSENQFQADGCVNFSPFLVLNLDGQKI